MWPSLAEVTRKHRWRTKTSMKWWMRKAIWSIFWELFNRELCEWTNNLVDCWWFWVDEFQLTTINRQPSKQIKKNGQNNTNFFRYRTFGVSVCGSKSSEGFPGISKRKHDRIWNYSSGKRRWKSHLEICNLTFKREKIRTIPRKLVGKYLLDREKYLSKKPSKKQLVYRNFWTRKSGKNGI